MRLRRQVLASSKGLLDPLSTRLQACGLAACVLFFISILRSGKTDLDRLIWFLRIHNHGLGRLHIHELVLDFFYGFQGKFLGFFWAFNHE
jgi:hypothetical protein